MPTASRGVGAGTVASVVLAGWSRPGLGEDVGVLSPLTAGVTVEFAIAAPVPPTCSLACCALTFADSPGLG